MRHLRVVMLITCGGALSLPAFCEPEIYPAVKTQAAARRLSVAQVKAIRIRMTMLGLSVEVTDRATIRLLLEGLKTATETNIANQVNYVDVIDRNGRVVIHDNFGTLSPADALSPKFAEGLIKAGAIPQWMQSKWQQDEQQRQQALARRRVILALSSAFLLALALFLCFLPSLSHRVKELSKPNRSKLDEYEPNEHT